MKKSQKALLIKVLIVVVASFAIVDGVSLYQDEQVNTAKVSGVSIQPENQVAYGEMQGSTTIGRQVQPSAPVPVKTVPTPSKAPSIKVLSPNGGEIVKIGDTIPVTWKTSQIFPAGYTFVITAGLGDSYLATVDASATTTSYSRSLTIPSHYVTGDILEDVNPGAYKVNVLLFDGKVPMDTNGRTCQQRVQNGSEFFCRMQDIFGNIVASDQSDNAFTVVNK